MLDRKQLRELAVVIEIIFKSHPLPPGERERLLQEVLEKLRLRLPTLESPVRWLMLTLHQAVERRQQELAREAERLVAGGAAAGKETEGGNGGGKGGAGPPQEGPPQDKKEKAG